MTAQDGKGNGIGIGILCTGGILLANSDLEQIWLSLKSHK